MEGTDKTLAELNKLIKKIDDLDKRIYELEQVMKATKKEEHTHHHYPKGFRRSDMLRRKRPWWRRW